MIETTRFYGDHSSSVRVSFTLSGSDYEKLGTLKCWQSVQRAIDSLLETHALPADLKQQKPAMVTLSEAIAASTMTVEEAVENLRRNLECGR